MPRNGYTLPVFAVAAAKAALLHLQCNPLDPVISTVSLDLLPGEATIPIQQVARLDSGSSVGITISDPGDNLDLTRNTPIWSWVQLRPRQVEPLILQAGDGLGTTITGEPAIYQYARQLFAANLQSFIPPDQTIIATIILPEGRLLAQRTSNEAFGILKGLSLLGTRGISYPLSNEEHLEELRRILQSKIKLHNSYGEKVQSQLVFCIGSHGMGVAQKMGLPETAIIQTGNWIGALLLEAGVGGVKKVLLIGYQGKLVKLAAGIFNTSSHLGDAKLEIIGAAVAKLGGSLAVVKAVLDAKTADDAYQRLVELDWADRVFQALALTISQKAEAYVQKYGNVPLTIGTILFDRQGRVIGEDKIAGHLLDGWRLV